MHSFLLNLMVGIIGGIYSSVIVSRIFLLREELEEQLDILRKRSYYFGTLIVYFDLMEEILKLRNDTSKEIAKEIRRDPEYLEKNDIIRVSDVLNTLKVELLDKSIEKICREDNPLVLKNKQFIELRNITIDTVRKYKNIEEFKFKTIDDSKKEINDLEKKYEICINRRNRYLILQMLKDKVLIVLFVLLLALCISVLWLR